MQAHPARLFGVILLLAALGSACSPGAPATGDARPSGAAAAPTPGAAPAAGASSSASPGAAPAAAVVPLSPPVKVRFGVLPVSTLGMVGISDVRGYFTEEGLDVELVPFDSGARQVAPLAAGQLEVGAGSHSAGLFNALASGIDIKIVGSNLANRPGRSSSAIVARKDLVDSGFREGADLRGKTLAFTAAGTTVHINVARYLEVNGVRSEEVSLVELSQPDMNLALANGAIDLASQAEPLVTLGVEQGFLTRLHAVTDFYPNREASVLMYSGQFIKQQPEAARRMMVAYLRGIRAFEDAVRKGIDKDAIMDIMVERTQVKDRTLYDKMYQNGSLSMINPDGYVDVDSIVYDHDWLLREGMINTRADLSSVIDNQFVDYALGRIGRYNP